MLVLKALDLCTIWIMCTFRNEHILIADIKCVTVVARNCFSVDSIHRAIRFGVFILTAFQIKTNKASLNATPRDSRSLITKSYNELYCSTPAADQPIPDSLSIFAALFS